MRNVTKVMSGVVLSAGLASGAQAFELSISPPNQGASVGSPVNAAVQVSGLGNGTAPSLGAYDINVNFDSNVLSYQSFNFGTQLGGPANSVQSVSQPSGGTINLAEVSLLPAELLDQIQPGTFALGNLQFTTTAPGSSSLSFGNVSFADADGNNLVVLQTNNGFVVTNELATTPALTSNNQSIAEALDQACPQADPSTAFGQRCSQLYALSPSDRQRALVQLTPEQVMAQGTVPINMGALKMDNLLQRLAALRHGGPAFSVSLNSIEQPIKLANYSGQYANGAARGGAAGSDEPMESPLGVFAQAKFSAGDVNTNPNQVGFDSHTYGVTLGADYRFTDKLVSGLAFTYNNMQANYDQSRGGMDTNSFLGALYGSYYLPKDFYIDWLASYGDSQYDLTRQITYTGFNTHASSDPVANQYDVALNLGKEFNIDNWLLNPYLRAEYINLQVDGFRENGGDGWALDYGDQSMKSFITSLGGQMNKSFSMPWGILTPGVRFEWEHQYKNNARAINAQFLGAPAGLGTFSIATASPDRNYFNLGGSVSATFSEGRSAFLRYETRLGQQDISNHIVELGVRVPF